MILLAILYAAACYSLATALIDTCRAFSAAVDATEALADRLEQQLHEIVHNSVPVSAIFGDGTQ